MNMTTNETDLPLSDPAHPLHRPVTQAAPAATPATEPAKPAKEKKAKAAKKAKPTKDATAAKNPRSIVPLKLKERYKEHGGSNGDKIALAFKPYTTTTNEDGRECLDEDKLNEVARANSIEVKNYAKMNNGQKRMNVGNKLRGTPKQGKTISIGSVKFADAKKALVVTPAKAKTAKSARKAAPAEAQAAA